MKNLYIFLLYLIGVAISFGASAQGCVAVKNMSSCSLDHGDADGKSWQFSANYRYFRSYKHFRGEHEEKHRVEQGTEVINNDNSIILGVGYTINKRWTVSAAVPFIFINRSSLYEHYGNPTQANPTINPRFHTQSTGFGDVRINGYYNALSNDQMRISLGLGVKLPTGNYQVKDDFHKKGSDGKDSIVHKVVDQSIQLGDGGFGFSTEFDAVIKLTDRFEIYANGLYLFNPRNTNGVSIRNLTPGVPLSDESSVPDQYLLRVGAHYRIKAFQFGVGGRYEGIASEDIIGKSDGFRRPGYIISIEPSIFYSYKSHVFGVSMPVALKRNRVQNTIDKARTRLEGTYQIGDAAFADYLLSISYAYRFGK